MAQDFLDLLNISEPLKKQRLRSVPEYVKPVLAFEAHDRRRLALKVERGEQIS